MNSENVFGEVELPTEGGNVFVEGGMVHVEHFADADESELHVGYDGGDIYLNSRFDDDKREVAVFTKLPPETAQKLGEMLIGAAKDKRKTHDE